MGLFKHAKRDHFQDSLLISMKSNIAHDLAYLDNNNNNYYYYYYYWFPRKCEEKT